MFKTDFPVIDAIYNEMKTGDGELTARYLHLTDAQRAINSAMELARAHGVPNTPETDYVVDEIINLVASSYDRQGFLNGFRMALALYQECVDTPPAHAGFVGGMDYPQRKEADAG